MEEESMTFDSYEEFKKYLDDYEKQTMNHFITIKKEKKFSGSNYKGKCLHWRDCPESDSCIPFVNVGQLLLGCHQGRDKNIGKKEKYRQQVAEKLKNTNSNKKIQSRFRTHPTKKLDCPAVINLKKIAMFPGFKEDLKCSLWTKRKTVLEFQQFVEGDKPIDVVYKFVAKFPAADAHKYHVQGEFAGMREPVDPLVRQKVVELVKNGITKVPDIQKAVRAFVVRDLFPNQSPPPMIRRRYHPSPRDIKNMMYVAKKTNRQKQKDQEEEPDNLDELITKGKEEDSEDRIVLAKNDVTYLCQKDIGNKSVLFCHQTREQQRLLSIYGSMIVMDIICRSSTLPADVVFIYVRTNVDFQLVAGFIGDAGTAEAVEEGFLVMKEWDPEWTPEFFVMDHKVEMMEMVKRVFPGSEVFVSDFHREKLWKEWFAQQEPDMDQPLRDKTLELIRKMARAPTRDQYELALKALQGCEGWISSVKLQSWFATVWDAESWVMAFQPDKLCILLSAMNGVEKLHDALKVDYFKGFSIDTLFDVIQNYKDAVVPNFLQRYLESNIRCSSSYGKLNKALPVYLKDRPLDLVSHVMARSPVPALLTDNVMQLENGTFTVLNEKGRHHSVSLGNEGVFPSCTCTDWLQHWLPCRHFLAVFHHLGDQSSWQQLSPLYSNNPIFILDEECILQQTTSPEAMPQNSRAMEVHTRSASKRVTAKRSLVKLHKSDETLNASRVDDDVVNNSVKMKDASNMKLEENQAACQLLAQMGATPTVAEFPSERAATSRMETVDTPATSIVTTDDAVLELQADKSRMDTSCIPPTAQNTAAMSGSHELHELSESVEPNATTSATVTTFVENRQQEEDEEITSIQTLQQDCSRCLEQILQVTPTITDQTVLKRLLSHLESALKEAVNGS